MERLADYLQNYLDENVVRKNPGIAESMVVSQCLSNYYTCTETIFYEFPDFLRTIFHQVAGIKLS